MNAGQASPEYIEGNIPPIMILNININDMRGFLTPLM